MWVSHNHVPPAPISIRLAARHCSRASPREDQSIIRDYLLQLICQGGHSTFQEAPDGEDPMGLKVLMFAKVLDNGVQLTLLRLPEQEFLGDVHRATLELLNFRNELMGESTNTLGSVQSHDICQDLNQLSGDAGRPKERGEPAILVARGLLCLVSQVTSGRVT